MATNIIVQCFFVGSDPPKNILPDWDENEESRNWPRERKEFPNRGV